MEKSNLVVLGLILIVSVISCGNQGSDTAVESVTKTMTIEELRDKIAGGWAGKMVGVAYGARTEFRALGETYEDELPWNRDMVTNSIHQDDMYVQLSFMMAMDEYGIDAPPEKLAESYANAGYHLWHANVQGRKNFFDGIMPPMSGSPEYNLHADDIDFQIEADYIGFMCPGMPQTAIEIADRVGHIMNYGDGVYGGMFVDALYAEAFFNENIPEIVDRALLSIPTKSDYAECVRDVITLHAHYPDDWRAAWQELENKWGDVDICAPLRPFNIDAKLNGAYIMMGLLYGEGDFEKTMEVSTRCGQDSDCNPSNAAAVIGLVEGFSGIPEKWVEGIADIEDSLFIYTDYTFNTAVDNTLNYAKQLIAENGGEVTDTEARIRIQGPASPKFEDSFPNLVADKDVNVFDKSAWKTEGDWSVFNNAPWRSEKEEPYALVSDNAGDSISFTFDGTGVVILGCWKRDGGKADVFIDGEFHRTIDTHFFWYGQEKIYETFLWHILNLEHGTHTVKLVAKGEKKDESEGANIYVSGATIFKTGQKKNELVKFSFE